MGNNEYRTNETRAEPGLLTRMYDAVMSYFTSGDPLNSGEKYLGHETARQLYDIAGRGV